MGIDEAIETLEGIPTQKPQYLGGVSFDAIKLGIEALKEVARARRIGPPLNGWRLPGETEE